MRYPTITIRSDVLESWLKVSAYTKSRLAGELGISKGRVSQLLTARTEPSAHLIAKLLTVTHLPFERIFRIVRNEVQVLSSVPHNTTSTARKTAVEVVETQSTAGESLS